MKTHSTQFTERPLPEIPASLEKPLADTQKKQRDAVDEDRKEVLRKREEEMQELSAWLWFEFTPYEVGCDRLGGKAYFT